MTANVTVSTAKLLISLPLFVTGEPAPTLAPRSKPESLTVRPELNESPAVLNITLTEPGLFSAEKEALPLVAETVKYCTPEFAPVDGVSSSKFTDSTSAGGVPDIVSVMVLPKVLPMVGLMLPLVPAIEMVV